MGRRAAAIGFILFLGAILPAAGRAQDDGLISFRNMGIGIGFNRTAFDLQYDETNRVKNNDTKQSLLIDVRGNFDTRYGLQFSSIFQLWSWTDNSGRRPNDPQNGMNDFAFMFDLLKFVQVADGIDLYGGGGGGVHFITYWTKFPLFNPYYEPETGNQLRQITVHETEFMPDLLGGIEYQIPGGLKISAEIRYEFSANVQQWKYFAGISFFE